MSIIEKYNIKIFTDKTYEVGSAENINKYDSEYLEAENKYNSTFVGIKIYENKTINKKCNYWLRRWKLRNKRKLKNY